jgi:hypothetical protein
MSILAGSFSGTDVAIITYNILPNFPAPISPIWTGLPLASRSASLVERLVMIDTCFAVTVQSIDELSLKQEAFFLML